jgi:hypothetical protein
MSDKNINNLKYNSNYNDCLNALPSILHNHNSNDTNNNVDIALPVDCLGLRYSEQTILLDTIGNVYI